MFKKKPLRINSYLSYGSAIKSRITGRALKDKNIEFSSGLGIRKTLKNFYKQFESDEIPHIKIKLTLADGTTFITTTDEEGYYHFDKEKIVQHTNVLKNTWTPYTVSFLDCKQPITANNSFKGEILIPDSMATYGVISDIDDTILHTGVTSLFKWRVIINTLFKNFDKRLPLEGTVDFYKKLHQGTSPSHKNPIFYVSNSPWNLYDYLTAFLNTYSFPKGPILLRDFRTPFDKTPKPKIPHKEQEIINLLTTYPEMKFILIGDCGEKDADIYIAITKKYPDRILAIYLRSVNHQKKEQRIQKLIDTHSSCPTLIIHSSAEAEQHAQKAGFIK
ncbi:App1 family protein [Aquimarina hainanensis]|uniref:App1 family protein n=1 Tax=Aquimarina hainanensis TaxID=1578017 RepID=A0ABW5NBH9_9FLAO|nr:phosphatase domain-containing protein [Aquimarina sp. TRL1]QKX05249.1 DUF2183 domain-containing protein [Aquimarina sp. TRL1]